MLTSTRQGRGNRALGHVMLAQTMCQNRANNLQKTGLKSTLQLGSILEPTWLHFGTFLDAKTGQDGTQSFQKCVSESIQKMITFCIALGTDFDRFWASTWLPRGGPRNHFSTFLLALGPVLGPRGPQDPPRPPKSLQDLDFG